MRFRSPIGLPEWTMAGIGLFSLVQLISPLSRSKYIPICLISLALSNLAPRLFTYWESRAEGLWERRLWRTQQIPWEEILRVSGWPGTSGKGFQIDFARSAPLSDRGTIYASPADRDSFLAELRQHAPHAEMNI